METALSDVIVHLNEDIDEETLRSIEQGLRQDEGVVSVGHRPGQAHLMMIVYDSAVAPAANLLHRFESRGLHAQLIGF